MTAALALFAPVWLGCTRSPMPPPTEPLQTAAPQPAWFEDDTIRSGLKFDHDPGPTGTYFMPQSMGSGAAFFDCNGDGLLDIYLVHQGGPGGKKNQLFQQLTDHQFKDISAGSGLDFAGLCTGVAVADVNNDGRPDVVVTQYGGVKLLLNLGDGRFREATDDAALSNPLWAMSAAFLDFDRDGWLDLVIVNYLDYDAKVVCRSPQGARDFCGPNQFAGRSSKVFRNRGIDAKADNKTPPWRGFEDVSFASGLGRLPGPGLGVTSADFDGDGWPDVFVANDGQPNRLWINQKNGTFRDEAASRGVGFTGMGNAYAGMGIAVGDVAGHGLLDLYVTHLGTETHTLWRQGPRGLFRDQTVKAGLTGSRRHGTGFGALLADFDLDGALDLAVVNGRVHIGGAAQDSTLGFWKPYAEKNQLFANDGVGKFRDISDDNPPFCDYWNVGRGLACADFDNDGAPDLLVTSIGGPARLFRNVAPNRGHWLAIRAFDPRWRRDAYGAEVRIRAGKRELLRVISPAESYLSSSSPIAQFGLGKATSVDVVQIIWPDGVRELFPGGPVDRKLELRRGEGRTQ